MLIELTMKGNYNGIYIDSYCYFCEYEKEETIETETETKRERERDRNFFCGNKTKNCVYCIEMYQHEFLFLFANSIAKLFSMFTISIIPRIG